MAKLGLALVAVLLSVAPASGQQPDGVRVVGRVTDDSAGILPGVTVELRSLTGRPARHTQTSDAGEYAFTEVVPGRYQLTFTLINFASVVRRDVDVVAPLSVDAVMHLALNAEVTVSGIAQSASQGVITARQLDARPLMRIGEVLETVPGVIATQHSG